MAEQRKMLESVFDLREEIATFLEEKKLGAPEFRNAEWVSKLAFLTDITSHMNNFNTNLQGSDQLINPLSAKFIKWSNTLKQFVGKLPTNCLSVFDHFSGLALKGLTNLINV